jgi:hypothetical protein
MRRGALISSRETGTYRSAPAAKTKLSGGSYEQMAERLLLMASLARDNNAF